ncbi:hypothetical protein RJT11_05650 [Segatella copri]|uniref:hypothetical protein n=1 Tax=Segatella copri TaxID=165179 RepID=UPI00294AC65E|nr:hypothetical protein [Segatella copri]WOG05009.1 hypothetical protein RJT11_05650 [Segatella copri]
MKIKQYITLLTTVLIGLNACESSDLPIQHADSYDYITFAVKTQKTQTRAQEYEGYDASRHPQTLGVFGYYNLPDHNFTSAEGTSHAIFNNETVNYDKTSGNWKTNPERKWDDYKNNNFDFFGYMPQNAQASLTKSSTSESTYVLSIPYTIQINGNLSPILFDLKQAPIICAQPEHKEGTTAGGTEKTFERVVEMRFDQTMTGYYLNFQLDTRMNKLRHFRIKGVKLYGTLPTGGTLSRSYTFNGNSWTAEAIKWTDLQTKEFDATNGIALAKDKDAKNPAPPAANDTLNLNDTKFRRWGATFYAPSTTLFVPTIAVTYDVTMEDENKKEITTRKDVTSTIILNNQYFSTLKPESTATIYPINILIQPRFLYVLADQDAWSGFLLVDK